MSLLDVILPKKYRNSKVLYEQNLDAWRHATEEAFANVNANFTQLAKDLFPTGYDYDNTGQAFYYTSLLEIINLVITGGTPITGTSSDTFTINTDGNSAVLTTANETASHTYSFPDGSGEFVLKDLTQTLTLKTLVTPTIASFVNATHDHTNAAGGGDLTTYIHKTNTGNDVADPTQNGDVVTKGWGASAYDAIGAAGAVQSNLNTHTGLTGTNVHGLGTASLNNTGDFDAAGVAAGLVTQTLHGVVLGTGAGTLAATAEGTNGTVLRGVTGSNPSFGAVNLATDVTGVLPAANGGGGALSSGSIPFSNGTNLIENLTAYQQLFFDNTNHRLGVGTVAPGYGIHLYGSALGSDSPSIVVENLNASGHANLRMITAAGADWTLRAREAQNLYLVDSSSTPINRIAATSDELHLVFGPTSAANPYIHKSGRATTTGSHNTPDTQTVLTITVPSSSTMLIRINVVGTDASDPDRYAIVNRWYGFTNNGGTLTRIHTGGIDNSLQDSCGTGKVGGNLTSSQNNISMVVSGSDVLLQVTGDQSGSQEGIDNNHVVTGRWAAWAEAQYVI